MTPEQTEILSAIADLVAEIDVLRRATALSAEHVRWRERAVNTIDRIFGPGSRFQLQFEALTWKPKTSWLFVDPADPEGDRARKYHEAYLADLETARGLLEAARDRVREGVPERNVAAKGTPADPSKVFVVHGRDQGARDAIFTFLRAIGLRPIEWIEAIRFTGKASPFIGEVLDAAFREARAIVVLLTGDDEARLRQQLRSPDEPAFETQLMPQARPNVLFEAGLAFGRNPDRTLLVQLGSIRSFSDIAGRHIIVLGNGIDKRQDLANRLRTAGCAVTLEGTDWHKAGDFSASGSGNTLAADQEEPEGLSGDAVSALVTLVLLDVEAATVEQLREKSGGHSLQRMLHALDELQKAGLVVASHYVNAASDYTVTPEGRRLLANEGLL